MPRGGRGTAGSFFSAMFRDEVLWPCIDVSEGCAGWERWGKVFYSLQYRNGCDYGIHGSRRPET